MTNDAFHIPKSAARNYRNDHKYRADVKTVNYSGRPRMCNLKCPDWKKCVVEKVYYKKKKERKNGKHTAYQEITFFVS